MGFEDLITKADLENAVKMILAAAAKQSESPKKPTWMNLKQAAEYIKDKTSTLGAKVRKGEIPYIRDGHLIKFKVSDLDAYMEARRVISDAEAASLASVFQRGL